MMATSMAKIVRVGVTFPPDLLADLDEVIDRMGYESRSKAVQDSVRLFVSEKKWLREEKAIKPAFCLWFMTMKWLVWRAN